MVKPPKCWTWTRIQNLNPTRLSIIPLDKIYWDNKYRIEYRRDKTCRCCGGERYLNADIRYPGILFIMKPNSYGEIYHVLDGCHRIQKMLDQGFTEALFFITTKGEMKQSDSKNPHP